jgi:putative oxidoreductase
MGFTSSARRKLTMHVAALIGRILLASIFVASGFVKLGWAADLRDVLIAHYFETSPALGLVLVIGSGLLELMGAASLLVGYRTRWGVYLLVAALIPATFVYHLSMGEENQAVHLLKNASILGGLVLVWAFGPGDLSLDAKRPGARAP